MSKIAILCVEDESEVRDVLERDLKEFSDTFRIEMAEDVKDAKDVVHEIDVDHDILGLVLCDHVMPGVTGVDFMVELNHAPGHGHVRKVLITGQAMLEDTIKAVNEADLDHYIAKPWTKEELHEVVRKELTDFIIQEGIDPLPYVQLLDGPRLMEIMSKRKSDN